MSDLDVTIIVGAGVITMDPSQKRAEAIAFCGDSIIAVGSQSEVFKKAGPKVNVVELDGGVILPGFIDPHHHLFLVAADKWGWRPPDPAPKSMEVLLRQIRQIVSQDESSGWLRIHGYKSLTLAERRFPTARELDSACPDRPLLLLGLTYHESSVNSLGLGKIGWNGKTPDPPGGRIVRDSKGNPTGALLESASFIAEAISRKDLLIESGSNDWFQRANSHCRKLIRSGITRIGDAAVPPSGMVLYERAAELGLLPITVHRFPVGALAVSQPETDFVSASAVNSRVPVGPSKLLVDGGERCHLCLSSRQLVSSVSSTLFHTLRNGTRAFAIANRGGFARRGTDGRYHTGIRVLDDGELVTAVQHAIENGRQVALHAVGNGAVASAIGAIEATHAAEAGLSSVPRIEHAMVVDRLLAERIFEVGALVVTQPIFLDDLSDELTVLPFPSPLRLLPLRTLLDSGVTVAASSDFPAAHFNPLAGIQVAVTRSIIPKPSSLDPEQVDVEEAIGMYTTSAAKSLGISGRAGILKEGAVADLVVLSGDPLTTPIHQIADLEIRQTWVAGQLVFQLNPETH